MRTKETAFPDRYLYCVYVYQYGKLIYTNINEGFFDEGIYDALEYIIKTFKIKVDRNQELGIKFINDTLQGSVSQINVSRKRDL